MAQLVEHILGKDEVISSTLISSSKNPVHLRERDFYLLLLTSSLLPAIMLFLFAFIDIRLFLIYNIITLIFEAVTMGHSEKHNDHQKSENVWLGALGAFLFSLIGAATFFLLNAIGLIESLSGFITVFCAINGYAIFAKKESKRGVIISLVIAAVVILVSWYFCFCLTAVSQLNASASEMPAGLRNTTTLGEFLPHSFDVIKKQPEMLISLGLSLV